MKIKLLLNIKKFKMDFHGKGDTVIISDTFPSLDEKETICLHFPSLYNKKENGMFVGYVNSTVIAPPFEYHTPVEDKHSDFVLALIEGEDDEGKGRYYKPTKEKMPASEEITNAYGFKLHKFKGEDGRNKYFCDDFRLTLEEAKQRWNSGFPIVSFVEGSTDKPKTHFPSKANGDRPNLFLIILINISNMDFERIETFDSKGLGHFLSVNGLRHYKNLLTLSKMLKLKPDFLNRKYNGVFIKNKQNLQNLLLDPPPYYGNHVSKWKALEKITKMIKEHH